MFPVESLASDASGTAPRYGATDHFKPEMKRQKHSLAMFANNLDCSVS